MLDTLVTIARDYLVGVSSKKPCIGIGIEDDCSFVQDMLDWTKNLPVDVSLVDLVLYGSMNKMPVNVPDGIRCNVSKDPSDALVNNLRDGTVDAVIRGKLPSSPFLKSIKHAFSMEETYRLACLGTASGKTFFFGPVGIDEAGTTAKKRQLVMLSSRLLGKLGILPSIHVLSAGRLDDVDRNQAIGDSIRSTIDLVESMKKDNDLVAGTIHHGEILIENAIASDGNVIIAPDGISGNLVYRTLVHLGNGRSYGAFYLGDHLPGPVIDTSRVGPPSEYGGALILALCGLALRNR